MQLKFPRTTWKQRYRYTKDEVLHICNGSSTIKFNEEKWNQNKEYYEILEGTGKFINEKVVVGDIEIPVRTESYEYKAYEHVSGIYHEGSIAAFICSADVTCVMCGAGINWSDEGDIIFFDDEYNKSEAICDECLTEIRQETQDKTSDYLFFSDYNDVNIENKVNHMYFLNTLLKSVQRIKDEHMEN